MSEELSWEEIVNRVTIPSNYLAGEWAANQWDEIFTYVKAYAAVLRELVQDTRPGWRGLGADASYRHIGQIAAALDTILRTYQRVSPALREAAKHLRDAVHEISIPTDMYEEVKQRHIKCRNMGIIDEVAPNSFRQLFSSSWLEHYLWYEESAQAAYRRLCQQYRDDAANVPETKPIAVPGVKDAARPGGAGVKKAGAVPSTSGVPGSTGLNVPSSTTPSLGAVNPAALPKTTMPDYSSGLSPLPGVDPAGSSGALAGLSKLGKGFGGGGGAGGLDLPMLGPEVATGPMSGGMGQVGALAAGRSALGVGAGAANSVVASPMGGGMGAGLGDQGQQFETKLVEDREIFTAGVDDLPSGVLDA